MDENDNIPKSKSFWRCINGKSFQNSDPLPIEVLKQKMNLMQRSTNFSKNLFVLLLFFIKSKNVRKRDDIRDANNQWVEC